MELSDFPEGFFGKIGTRPARDRDPCTRKRMVDEYTYGACLECQTPPTFDQVLEHRLDFWHKTKRPALGTVP